MKKAVCVILFFTLFMVGICIPAWSEGSLQKKRIGVLIGKENQRYRESMKGIQERLKQEGLGDAEVEIKEYVSKGDKATDMRMAQELAAAKMDLYVAIGTAAGVALLKEVKDAPIVFSIIYDPVAAGLVDSLQSSGNNMTGTSTYLAMEKVVAVARKIVPVKDFAVLYTPGERNSESQLKDLLKEGDTADIRVIPVPLLNVDEVSMVVATLKGKVDAVYVTGSGVFDKSIGLIAEALAGSGLLTVTHLLDYVDKGVVLGVGADAHELGMISGGQILRIFNGGKPTEIPVATTQNLSIYVNKKAARSAGVSIPDSVVKTAAKVIE